MTNELLARIDLLEKENQELKKRYENAVADYETTMFEKEQLNSLVNSCQEEIRLLKKNLEETRKCLKDMFHINIENDKELDKKENQQKVFIKYLEDEIKLYKNDIQNFSKDYNVYFSLINDLRVSKAKTEEEVIKLCHYTNLQLLKAKDNMKKHTKLDWRLDDVK